MIERLRVQNYKCLRDVTLDLSPFTVLIGPNDSGKSSILDAIGVLGRPSSTMLADGATRETLVWRGDRELAMSWEVSGRSGDHRCEYALSLPVGGDPLEERLTIDGEGAFVFPNPNTQSRGLIQTHPRYFQGVWSDKEPSSAALYALVDLANPTTKALIGSITSSRKYRLDPAALRQTLKLVANPTLTTTGRNLASVLDALITGPDRSAITNLEVDLRAAVPTLQGVSLRTVSVANDQKDEGPGFGKALEFVLAGSGPRVTIPASQASEGALLLTAFLALVHGDTPDVLLVEEPENGLHPSRLKMVIELLRRISTGEVGNRPRQVIVTTHSPILLNYAAPEEVRVVRRDAETGTSVRALTEVRDLSKLLDEFALGELWYMLGEDGLFAPRSP